MPGADAVSTTIYYGGSASDIETDAMMAFGVISGLHTPVTFVQKNSIFSVKTVTGTMFTVSLPPHETVFNM